MQELRLKLENCYGINKIHHTINFRENNITVIYAPNGTMKTSFANTFKDLLNDRFPSDRVYSLQTVCEVKDENDNTIDKDYIIVITPFDEALTKEQGKLMVSPELQQRYITLHKNLAEEKTKIFINVKQQLNYGVRTKFDPEQSISEDFSKPIKDIYNTLKLIKSKLDDQSTNNFSIVDQ